jgi:hypothetical protein
MNSIGSEGGNCTKRRVSASFLGTDKSERWSLGNMIVDGEQARGII